MTDDEQFDALSKGIEQRETLSREQAKENLETAIKDWLDASEYNDGMLMDWVVLTAQHHVREGGRVSTSYTHVVREDQAIHRSFGIVRMAATKLQARILGIIPGGDHQ